MDIKLHNTLTGKKEELKPIKKGFIGIYSCGPTVYWNQHIGHMFAYVQWDALVRFLKYSGYQVKWVMNITDVGHLTGDNEGEADQGEDKMEKGAKREGLSVWQVADKYIAQFKESMSLLNIPEPDVLCRATEHIPEQIDLIKKIEDNGFAYRINAGVAFETKKFPDYPKFARLNLEKQEAGARIEVDPEKKNPWDFMLWFTNQPNHIMQWKSPWGTGFPGWHIECTAMSTKYLGETFDIHTGGKEHIPVHHTNEIAQGFGAFGHQTANYWLHNEWMTYEGQKISKSLGNSILVSDLVEKGYDPLSLRYLIMTTHYKTGLNFTWESLEGGRTAYFKLKNFVAELRAEVPDVLERAIWDPDSARTPESMEIFNKYKNQFMESLADDLNVAKAIGLVWQLVKSKDVNQRTKLELLLDFDRVLGLKLSETSLSSPQELPEEVLELKKERDAARREKNWEKSDELRKKIEEAGYSVEDLPAQAGKNGESILKKIK